MAAMEKMTWVRSQKRWTKQHRKRTYSVSCRQLGTASTKEASRSASNHWWEAKQAELDLQASERAAEPVWLSERAIRYSRDGVPTETVAVRVGRDINNMVVAADRLVEVVDDALASPLLPHDDVPSDRTIGALVAAFTAHKRRQAETGHRSTGRYGAIRSHLERFRDWHGEQKPIDGITADVVAGYHAHLLDEISGHSISRYYARDLFASLKQFVRWCWGKELLTLPRNIDSRDFGFRLKYSRIVRFTRNEIHSLLEQATDRTRLYILLMLNCGMTQQDISDLHPDEVDWSRRRIRRKRSKTSDHDSVPEVEYPLWADCFRLLQQERSEHAQHVLSTATASPSSTKELTGSDIERSIISNPLGTDSPASPASRNLRSCSGRRRPASWRSMKTSAGT